MATLLSMANGHFTMADGHLFLWQMATRSNSKFIEYGKWPLGVELKMTSNHKYRQMS